MSLSISEIALISQACWGSPIESQGEKFLSEEYEPSLTFEMKMALLQAARERVGVNGILAVFEPSPLFTLLRMSPEDRAINKLRLTFFNEGRGSYELQ